MKKTLKKLLAVVLTLSLGLAISVPAFASEDDNLDSFIEAFSPIREEENRRIEKIVNSQNSDEWLNVFEENLPLDENISMYPICTDCNWYSVSVCAGDANLCDEGYHTGFLGIPTDCYAYYFNSRGAEMCSNCYKVLWQYDGMHYCWEIHKKCSKGDYDVCPMQVS